MTPCQKDSTYGRTLLSSADREDHQYHHPDEDLRLVLFLRDRYDGMTRPEFIAEIGMVGALVYWIKSTRNERRQATSTRERVTTTVIRVAFAVHVVLTWLAGC